MKSIKLTHIINPAGATLEEDDPAKLREAQPFVYQSMENAIRFSNLINPALDISVTAVFFPEDKGAVPGFAQKCAPLTRSVLDCAVFNERRVLPILADIMDRVPCEYEDEYFVYTNSDIILSPMFYSFVAAQIAMGHDAITITRRTLPEELRTETDLSVICADLGEKHPGHDCFIFSGRIKQRLELGKTCIGAQHLVPPFLAQLMYLASSFIRFDDRHLTFHIGDDRAWNRERYADYAAFNFEEGRMVIERLHAKGLLVDHSLSRSWLKRFNIES